MNIPETIILDLELVSEQTGFAYLRNIEYDKTMAEATDAPPKQHLINIITNKVSAL